MKPLMLAPNTILLSSCPGSDALGRAFAELGDLEAEVGHERVRVHAGN